MKIGIDIDDTLTDTKSLQKVYWGEYVQNHKSNIYDKNIPDNINHFGDPYIDEFWNLYRERLFFPNIKEYASDIIKQLRRDKHIIYIITSRHKSDYKNLINDLENMFKTNDIEYDKIVTDVKDKGLFLAKNDIDILIDDDIRHCKSVINYGKSAILFNNLPNYNDYMTDDWREIYKIINLISKK